MQAVDRELPSTDGLACFNRMYRLVTQSVRLRIGAGFFADSVWMDHLDVVFGNLYLAALIVSDGPAEPVPRAWAALLEQRSNSRVTPLQFALAGMNAHINHDLPVALVNTCLDLGTAPGAGTHRQDYDQINSILAEAERSVRESVEGGFLLSADRVLPGLQDVIANWDVVKARETAWANAATLWAIRQVSPAVADDYLDGLDRLVSFAGRGLLIPLG